MSTRRAGRGTGRRSGTRVAGEALAVALLVSLVWALVVGWSRREPLVARGFWMPAIEEAARVFWWVLGSCLVVVLVVRVVHRVLPMRRWTSLAASGAAGLVLWALWSPGLALAGTGPDAGRWSVLAGLSTPTALAVLAGGWFALSLLVDRWVHVGLPPRGGLGRGALAAVCLAAAAVQLGPRVLAGGPNVILIVIDCLRADHLSAYGYERDTTPHLERFCADAVRFENAISHSTYTKTSIASLFTSKNPYQHGVYRGSDRDAADRIVSDVLGDEHTTLAERLGGAGLVTGGWLHQGQLRSYMGFAQGFDFYTNEESSAVTIHQRFGAWRRRLGAATPYFAYLHYLDLHDPYRPQGDYATRYGRHSDIHERIDLDVVGWGTFHQEVRSGARVLSEADVEQLEASYDGLLRFVDAAVGYLFEQLKAEGVYDDSLIVVTSDHGDGFLEHGFLAHSAAPYDELVRVPLFVKLPGGTFGGTVVDDQVRLIDVVPTVLDVLGLARPVELEGTSLMPLMGGAASVEAARIAGWQPPGPAISEIAEDLSPAALSIRTNERKYLYFPAEERDELFDLAADPAERRSLVDPGSQPPADLQALRAQARAIWEASQEQAVEEVTLDPQTVEELRALGYVK